MTFGELIQQSKDICIDDQSTSYTGMTDSLTFIKREINNTISNIFTLMKEYRLQPPPKTLRTEAGKTYYSNPPGLMKAESFTIDLGSITPPLRIVQSQDEWNMLQQTYVTSGFPTRVFPRRDDFGIYPTPSDAYTITINGSYQPVRMTIDDVTTGVVNATYDSATITSQGLFTEAMVGRWFTITDSTSLIPNGEWYRLESFTNSSSMELSRTYTGSSVQGSSFIIGQSPELPEEIHQYIPYGVGSIYWAIRRMDAKRGQELANYFFTGDMNNPNRSGRITGGVLAVLNDLKTQGRGNSNLVEMSSGYRRDPLIDTIWGTTLSDSA